MMKMAKMAPLYRVGCSVLCKMLSLVSDLMVTIVTSTMVNLTLHYRCEMLVARQKFSLFPPPPPGSPLEPPFPPAGCPFSFPTLYFPLPAPGGQPPRPRAL